MELIFLKKLRGEFSLVNGFCDAAGAGAPHQNQDAGPLPSAAPTSCGEADASSQPGAASAAPAESDKAADAANNTEVSEKKEVIGEAVPEAAEQVQPQTEVKEQSKAETAQQVESQPAEPHDKGGDKQGEAGEPAEPEVREREATQPDSSDKHADVAAEALGGSVSGSDTHADAAVAETERAEQAAEHLGMADLQPVDALPPIDTLAENRAAAALVEKAKASVALALAEHRAARAEAGKLGAAEGHAGIAGVSLALPLLLGSVSV